MTQTVCAQTWVWKNVVEINSTISLCYFDSIEVTRPDFLTQQVSDRTNPNMLPLDSTRHSCSLFRLWLRFVPSTPFQTPPVFQMRIVLPFHLCLFAQIFWTCSALSCHGWVGYQAKSFIFVCLDIRNDWESALFEKWLDSPVSDFLSDWTCSVQTDAVSINNKRVFSTESSREPPPKHFCIDVSGGMFGGRKEILVGHILQSQRNDFPWVLRINHLNLKWGWLHPVLQPPES